MKEPSTKKRSPIFKSLILGSVLVVTIIILVFAWFTNFKTAEANGMSVSAVSGLGLQTSWESNRNFSTAIARTKTSLLKLPLITGDGKNFFQPALNRTTGDPLTDSSGLWQARNVNITPAKYNDKTGTYSDGQYYEEDIYFSSPKQLDVYLTNMSTVTPLDDDNDVFERKSDYGEFSKDNIAGAVRVGVFNVNEKTNQETPLYTWVPNDKYELDTNDNLIPITSTADIIESEGSFDPNDPAKTFGLKGNSDYTQTSSYLWEVLVNNTTHQNIKTTRYNMYKDKDGKYIAAITVQASTQVDHAILPTNQNVTTFPPSSYSIESSNKAGSSCETNYNNYWVGAYFDGRMNIDEVSNEVAKLTIDNNGPGSKSEFFGVDDRFQTLLQYDYDNGNFTNPKVIGFVFYNDAKNQGTNPSNWEGPHAGAGAGENIGSGGGTYIHYSINDGATVVISNKTNATTDDTFGINAIATSTNAVQLTMQQGVNSDGESYIYPVNPFPSQMFKTTLTAADTYAFRSLSTGKYLAIKDSNLVLQDTAFDFELKTGANGPLLYSPDSGKYISFNGRKFVASTSTDSAYLEIYQGSSFSFRKDGLQESNYQYLLKNTTGYNTLTNVKLTKDLTMGAGSVPVARLAKRDDNPDSNFYGHIRVRIWIEGTDREAKIPLAGGKFATHLEFYGQSTEATEPTT